MSQAKVEPNSEISKKIKTLRSKKEYQKLAAYLVSLIGNKKFFNSINDLYKYVFEKKYGIAMSIGLALILSTL